MKNSKLVIQNLEVLEDLSDAAEASELEGGMLIAEKIDITDFKPLPYPIRPYPIPRPPIDCFPVPRPRPHPIPCYPHKPFPVGGGGVGFPGCPVIL